MRRTDKVENILIRRYGHSKKQTRENTNLIANTIEAYKNSVISGETVSSTPTEEIPTFDDWLKNNNVERLDNNKFLYYKTTLSFRQMHREYWRIFDINY